MLSRNPVIRYSFASFFSFFSFLLFSLSKFPTVAYDIFVHRTTNAILFLSTLLQKQRHYLHQCWEEELWSRRVRRQFWMQISGGFFLLWAHEAWQSHRYQHRLLLLVQGRYCKVQGKDAKDYSKRDFDRGKSLRHLCGQRLQGMLYKECKAFRLLVRSWV